MKYKVGDKVLIEGKINKIEYGLDFLVDVDVDGKNIIINEEKIITKTYSDGLNDAWELARKIVLKAEMGGICYDDFKKIFGVGDHVTVLRTLSPQEALAKIEAYEVSQQIQVGDVVKSKDSELEFIVTAINGISVQGVARNGDVYNTERKHIEKTGRHIDISSILEQIRGDQ